MNNVIDKELTNKNYFADNIDVVDGQREVTARITMSVPDRVKEVVVAEGGDFTEFMTNPVVMMAHDYSKLPVGKVVQIKKQDNYVLAKIQFAPRPDTHVGEWTPDTIFSLYQSGFLKGFSIGFMPLKQRLPSQRDKQLYGEDTQLVTYRWELMELSVAPIPMLPEALALAVSKGLITKEIADNYIPKSNDLEKEEDEEVKEEHETTEEVPEEKPEEDLVKEEVKEEHEELEEDKEDKEDNKKSYVYFIAPEKKDINIDDMVKKEIAKQRGRMYLD